MYVEWTTTDREEGPKGINKMYFICWLKAKFCKLSQGLDILKSFYKNSFMKSHLMANPLIFFNNSINNHDHKSYTISHPLASLFLSDFTLKRVYLLWELIKWRSNASTMTERERESSKKHFAFDFSSMQQLRTRANGQTNFYNLINMIMTTKRGKSNWAAIKIQFILFNSILQS